MQNIDALGGCHSDTVKVYVDGERGVELCGQRE